MATEFDNALHWGLFLTGTTLTSETGKYVRVSELVLSALRATGVFSNMVDGIVAPATDKLWLDKNFDPAVLKEWDATGASWVPMSYGRLFGRAAVDKLVVTGGTGNAVVVSQSAGFQAARLYLMTPLADNSAAATINVAGVGTYGVTYGDGAEIGPTEFTAGRQAVLFFTGARFEVVFPLGGLSAAILAAQASASAAADSATLSQQYAANPEDVEVQPGLFSSRHYLAKVVAYWSFITNTLAGWIHGAIDKPTPVGADEIGIADSAGGLWGLKRLSLTNLAAWLASLTQTLTNKTITTPTLTLKRSATPVPTLAGDIQFGTSSKVLEVGDGTANVTFVPIPAGTTAGDIEYFTAAKTKVRLAKGTVAQVLQMNSGGTQPEWAPPIASHPGVADTWVNFNGTGTVAVYGSYGLTSITDSGVGDYAVNFAVNQPSVNYAVFISSNSTNGGSPAGYINGIKPGSKTVSKVNVQIGYGYTAGNVDVDQISVVVLGG